jgi:SPP1 family phage portal protein
LRGGIRFWQIADNKPQRATLYDDNGVTEYIKRANEAKPVILRQSPYKSIVRASQADGITINDGGTYGSFPIVPWYANRAKQSELVGIKEQIDCYDLIKSGFANDMDEANQILWILHNMGGMDDDISLAKFVERIKTTKAAAVDSDQQIESRTVEPPFEARQTYLTLLRKDLYEDAMALDTQEIAAGNVTATQITAAYEALSQAADDFEAQTIKFILGLLKVMGVTDYPKFDRSQVSNAPETTQMIMSAAGVLDNDTLIDKLPFLTPEEKEDVKKRLSAEQMNMANMGMNNE